MPEITSGHSQSLTVRNHKAFICVLIFFSLFIFYFVDGKGWSGGWGRYGV